MWTFSCLNKGGLKMENTNSSKTFVTKSKLSTNTLVKAAMFIGISIILGRFSFKIAAGTIAISFGRIPVVLSGMLLGPLAGGLTGAACDIIGFLLKPQGAFHPGFTFSAFLSGFIPGLVVLISRKKRMSLFNIIISFALVFIIVTGLLNTYFISQLIGKSFLILLPARISTEIVINILDVIIIYLLARYNVFKRI
ncbi:MAG: folate family ECF transporter S component [Firmicutes bacterium]|nr:folate family ECF transporter S component [Bacillota bacterium]